MNEATIIVAGKEFLKGKTQKGRPWVLAKLQDGESGQWFATFDIKSVFQDISFKDLSNGDLLKIDYEEEHNGKYQDLILKAVRRKEPNPESKDKAPIQDDPDSNGAGAQDPQKPQPASISEYFQEAQEAVLNIFNSLDPKKKRPSQETLFKTIIQVGLEWMHIKQGGQNGNLPTLQR
jgi:hypothetical protein